MDSHPENRSKGRELNWEKMSVIRCACGIGRVNHAALKIEPTDNKTVSPGVNW